MIYKIAEIFTDKPGGRYISDGPFSGEEFREKELKKLFEENKNKGERVIIDFDGGYGYGNSFLEESFGGLVRDGIKKEEILKIFDFKSNEEPSLIDKVKRYISEAKKWKMGSTFLW